MNVEQLLRNAAAEVDWPPTPSLEAAVVPRLRGARRVHSGYTPRVRRPLVIALAALLLMTATAAAIPGVREPVLEWLGLRGVHVERIPQPLPEPRGSKLALGEHTTLASARARLEFIPFTAAGLGEPAVWYERFPPGGQLGLVYRGGVLITEVQGQLQREYLFKFLHGSTGVEAFRIDGGRALWFEGPHQYAYADRTGAIRTDSVRTAGSTLLWHRNDLLIRVEGAGSRARAVRIARSLRAVP